MPRVKGSVQTRARRKKILKLAKGYFGSKHALYRTANEQVMRSLAYAYRDRKQTKRNFRKLWISRINAACKLNGFKYSLLINGLSKAGVVINRKMLADMAVNDPKGFADIIEVAKKGISGELRPVMAQITIKTPKIEIKTKNAEFKAPKSEAKAEVKAPKIEAKVEKTAAKTEKVAKPESIVVELGSLTVAQLKDLAQELGLTGLSALRKAELVEVIQAAQSK